ncbi:MAG: murein biosynthesis integral membrane protein MurJ [Bdellovibrionales bacterium]|nr:murein biosynthesis integral membrane protein MurJ [Bdellovibrionales bacterium]
MKSAGVMGIAVLISRVLGLVREQVFAALFGASTATDAYQIAFRIPNLLRDLFAEGAMSSALVPTFIKIQKEEGVERGWQLSTRVFVVLFSLVSLIAFLGIVFAEPLVNLYASAYREVPGKFELTVSMTRTMMPFFPLVALAAAFMAILNACGKFFIPSFASALFNLVSILVGVVLARLLPEYGFQPIEGMACGVIAGGLVQALIQWPVLRGVGFRPVWRKPFSGSALSDPGLRSMMFLMVPGTVGLAATQINILVNSVFATSVGEGAVSWLNYSFRLMQFPIGIFGVSLATATLPAFSRYWSAGEYSAASDALGTSIKRVFAINFPASAGLGFLGVPIIGLIFEHGRFHPSDTVATAEALAAYAVGLTAYSVVKVLVPVCYAIGETRFAVFSSFFSVVSNLLFNLLFVKQLGFVGLAFGTSITAILNSALLWILISRKLSSRSVDFKTAALLKSGLSYAGLAALMGVLVFGVDRYWLAPSLPGDGIHLKFIRVAVGVILGVSCYVSGSIFFGLKESLEFIELFKRRWRRGKN